MFKVIPISNITGFNCISLIKHWSTVKTIQRDKIKPKVRGVQYCTFLALHQRQNIFSLLTRISIKVWDIQYSSYVLIFFAWVCLYHNVSSIPSRPSSDLSQAILHYPFPSQKLSTKHSILSYFPYKFFHYLIQMFRPI